MKRMSILEMIDARERMLENRIADLEAEVEYWKQKYDELLRSSIQHGDAMMSNLLHAVLQPVDRRPLWTGDLPKEPPA